MKPTSPPRISSFVLRFVEEDLGQAPTRSVLRGSIRHIQSDQELIFTQWSDALAFMGRFVPVEALNIGELSDAQSQVGEEYTGQDAEILPGTETETQ